GAIQFGPIDELRKRYGELADVRGLPDSSITHPNLVIHPHQGSGRQSQDTQGEAK
ncbi:MAG: 4Fe-4S ferredoxin, partial [Providencia sp.]|nr:4Fe-4S ferredoxin [Providencia sp.]